MLYLCIRKKEQQQTTKIMKVIIKTHFEMDEWGWHTAMPEILGICTDHKTAKSIIKKDVASITEDWEPEDRPSVTIRNFVWNENLNEDTDYGFRFNDGEDGDEEYAENIYTYSVREI